MVYGPAKANARGNEGMHHDSKGTPSSSIQSLEPNLKAFFDHLLAAAHQGNATGVFRSGTAGAGFFDCQFKSASIAMKQIAFFHVTTICHGETSHEND